MHEYTVRISDAEKKALETDMESLQAWLDNVIHTKATRCINQVCKDALTKDGLLDASAREQIAAELSARSILVADPATLPLILKEQIVNASNVKSIEERGTQVLEV